MRHCHMKRESPSSSCVVLLELRDACSASLHCQLLELSREMKLDRSFNFLGGESLLLRKDHEAASILHDLDEKLGDDVVDQCNTLLGDAELRFYLFQNTVDVGLKRGRVQNLSCSGLLSGSLAATWWS